MSNVVTSSALFRPVRTIGLVCDDVRPWYIQKVDAATEIARGEEADFMVLVSVGRAYHLLDCKKLRVKFRSVQLPSKITALARLGIVVFVGQQKEIHVYSGYKHLGIYCGHTLPPCGMCAGVHNVSLKTKTLRVVSWNAVEVLIWDGGATSGRSSPISRLAVRGEGIEGDISSLATFKFSNGAMGVVLGYSSGELEVWDFDTVTAPRFRFRKTAQMVTCISVSPNNDAIAVGYCRGCIRAISLDSDNGHLDSLLKFFISAENGFPTALAFRSDAEFLVVGSSTGCIATVDLKKGLIGQLVPNAHRGRVTGLGAPQLQPLALSSGADNSLVVWLYEDPEKPPRQLRCRKGHMGNVTQMDFYGEGEGATTLLTASSFAPHDSFDNSANSFKVTKAKDKNSNATAYPNAPSRGAVGMTCFALDGLNELFPHSEIGKVLNAKKPTPLVLSSTGTSVATPSRRKDIGGTLCLTAASSRHFDWPNILSIHEHLPLVAVWSGHRKCLDYVGLVHPGKSRVFPSAVGVSACGNYAIVGYVNGEVHRFNLQSKIHWSEFTTGAPASLSGEAAVKKEKAHLGSVCGIIVVKNAERAITCCSHPEDFRLRTWNINSCHHEWSFCLKQATMHGCAGVADRIVVPYFCGNAKSDDSTNIGGALGRGSEKSASVKFIGCGGATLAVALTDGTVFVCDTAARNDDLTSNALSDISDCRRHILRTFTGFGDITAMEFSTNGRVLAVGTLNRFLYVYDLLSASLVDWLEFQSAVVSMKFHPNDAFLLTTHRHVPGGILVWANKTIFDAATGDVSMSGDSTTLLKAPFVVEGVDDSRVVKHDDNEYEEDVKFSEVAKEEQKDVLSLSKLYEPLERGALTLSGATEGTLHAIINLEEIKERNKPTEGVVDEAKAAPFFIPTAFQGTEAKFVAPKELETDDSSHEGDHCENALQLPSMSRIRVANNGLELQLQTTTKLQWLLTQEASSKDILQYMRGLSPSGINLAISELGPIVGRSLKDLTAMMKFFLDISKERRDADFVQAILQVFLQQHADEIGRAMSGDSHFDDDEEECEKSAQDVVRSREELSDLLVELKSRLTGDWTIVESQLDELGCFLKFLTHLQME